MPGIAASGPSCPVCWARSSAEAGYEGAKFVCSPPPRDAASQEAVWRAIAGGVFSVSSLDHAPFSFNDPQGKKLGGAEQPFPRIPNGVPGIETRLPLLFDGIHHGRLSLHQFVELTSYRPARLYGLYPRKGTIAIDVDADIVLWDPSRKVRIENTSLHHAADYTPYEGMRSPVARCSVYHAAKCW